MEDHSAPNAAAPAPSPSGDSPAPALSGTNWGGDLLWLSVIVVAAFVLRLVYVLQLQACPYFSTHVMDPQYHHQWAQAFANGERFWDGPYFRAPLYPWLLGLIYRVFGADNPLAPRVVQAVLGSLSCGLIYLIGRQAFSRAVGVIAGFAAATYWIFLYYDAELLIPVLIVFLDLLLLSLLLWTAARRRPLAWIACGLVLGLSAVARPNILLFAPALVVWIVVLHRPRWGRAFGYVVCLFVGTIVPILPITIRNYVVGKELVLIASQGGVNFYIGNNPHSDGMSAIIKGDPPEWWPCYQAQITRAQQALGHAPTSSEVSQWYSRQALRFMWEQPGRAAALLLKKLSYFWSRWEVSNNQDIQFIVTTYTPVVRYLPLGFWIVGPLGVLGLVLCLGRARAMFPLWGFVLIYMVSVVLFFVTARYRVPVVAVLILLGSHAVCWCVSAIRAGRWRAVGLAAIVPAAMGAVVYRIPPGVDTHMVHGHRFVGLLLAQQGRDIEAEQMLSETVKRAAASGMTVGPKTWYYLGYVRFRQHKFAQALPCYEEVLKINPDYPEARSNLAVTLAALGRFDQAAQHLEQIVRRDPDDPAARLNLGSALARLGRVDEATPHMLRAIELDSSTAGKVVETTEALRLRGNFSGAARLLRAAVERFPDNMMLTSTLIQLLANRSDPAARAEAVQLGEQACERTQHKNAIVLHFTALAYFRTGQTEQAVQTERRALETASRQGQAALVERFRRSLQEYERAARRDAAPADTP